MRVITRRIILNRDAASKGVGHRIGDHHINHLSNQTGMTGEIHNTIVFGATAQLIGVACRGAFNKNALSRAHHAASDGMRLFVDERLQTL